MIHNRLYSSRWSNSHLAPALEKWWRYYVLPHSTISYLRYTTLTFNRTNNILVTIYLLWLKKRMSFVQQILAPGGGILLIPFIRSVIMCLFMTTVTAFLCGVARIHMAILSVLAGGLLLSISFFMSEFEKVQKSRNGPSNSSSAGERAKTDWEADGRMKKDHVFLFLELDSEFYWSVSVHAMDHTWFSVWHCRKHVHVLGEGLSKRVITFFPVDNFFIDK